MIQFRLVAEELLLEPHRLGPGYPPGPFSLLHDGGLLADEPHALRLPISKARLRRYCSKAAIAAGKRGPRRHRKARGRSLLCMARSAD